MPDNLDLLQGTLDVLILKALTWGPQHGYGVARWIHDTSDETLLVEDRALYVALHRLEASGWVEAEWGVSENNRKAKYYRLTRAGRRSLTAKAADWTIEEPVAWYGPIVMNTEEQLRQAYAELQAGTFIKSG